MELLEALLLKNALIVAFVFVGALLGASFWVSRRMLGGRLPGVALAILAGLALAFYGNGKRGLAELPLFSGLALLGGSMLRDFAVVATAMGADLDKIRSAGLAGSIALVLGVVGSFVLGAVAAVLLGYEDPVEVSTIAAGACTYIVGPVTGTALGASSEVVAISIAAGVVKTVATTVATPLVARAIGLDNPHTAAVFGGLIGTTSGVAAGLAATDERLVPYGALTATFYTGLGCLLCPSMGYLVVLWVLG